MLIPRVSKENAVTLSPKKYNEIEVFQKNNPLVIERFSTKWNALKSNGSSMVIKSLSLTAFEQKLLAEYCSINSMSVGTFIRMAFYNDGAFSIPFLSGFVAQKRITLDFAQIDTSALVKIEYSNSLKTQKKMLNSFKNSPVVVKSIPVPIMLLKAMSDHLLFRKYPSWTGFVRLALLTYGVLPSFFTEPIHNSLHLIKMNTPLKVTKTNSVTLSASTPQLDYFLWNKLNEFSKKKYNISASMYFKMILFSKGIISEDFVGKNSMTNSINLDKMHSISSAISGDPKFPGLVISNTDIDAYKDLKPNKNVSISLSAANAAELQSYLKKHNKKLYDLFEENIYSSLKQLG